MGNKIDTSVIGADELRYMAFNGLIQWAQAVVFQSSQVAIASRQLRNHTLNLDEKPRLNYLIYASHCQDHYFVIAAYKLVEFREWTKDLHLFEDVDFSEIDAFSVKDIRNLRNIREHVVGYFKGDETEKWYFNKPKYNEEVVSRVENIIGGCLDYVRFSAATERLLDKLLLQPLPTSIA